MTMRAEPVELSAHTTPSASGTVAPVEREVPQLPVACFGSAESLLQQGELDRAEASIAAMMAVEGAGAQEWFLQARLLAARGERLPAQEACLRAIALWPDILPVLRLLSDLAAQLGNLPAGLDRANRLLLADSPDDLLLANRMASELCAAGRFAEALPYLRRAGPLLGHRDNALWNYTTALAATGAYHELLATEPMLMEFSRETPEPFSPFVHLVAAKLALRFDRDAVVRDAARQRGSSGWLDAAGLGAALHNAVRRRDAFSVLNLSHAHARLVVYASLRNHLELSRAELSAVVNSVWVESFGETIEQHGIVPAGTLTRELMAAISEADVIALADDGLLASAHEHFGFLAETRQVALERGSTLCAGLGVLEELHEAMPFLRPLLAEQPFLGVVGSHPELAERLGRFCQIGETRTYPVPAALHRTDVPAALRGRGHYPGLFEQTLAGLVVPQPGAVFLVAAGLLGPAYCGRIKRLGGIAIDIDPLVGRWMPV